MDDRRQQQVPIPKKKEAIPTGTCLILITSFHELFPNKEHIIGFTIPYIDGGASISRTARVFPTYLIFKPESRIFNPWFKP